MAYTRPRQRKKEESERLRGERGKFIDIRFERWHVVVPWYTDRFVAVFPSVLGYC